MSWSKLVSRVIINSSLLQAKHKETGVLAAAKVCKLDSDEDLEEFTVEVDILSECRHANIVELKEAFLHDQELWVNRFRRIPFPLHNAISWRNRGKSSSYTHNRSKEPC